MDTRGRAWVVVAGTGDVRIVAPSVGEPGFEIVAQFGAPRIDVPKGAPEARDAAAADPAHAFLRSVSAHISREAARGAFDHLLLFAPPSPLAELRAGLTEAAQEKIRTAQPLDLTLVALDGLPSHLEPHLAQLG